MASGIGKVEGQTHTHKRRVLIAASCLCVYHFRHVCVSACVFVYVCMYVYVYACVFVRVCAPHPQLPSAPSPTDQMKPLHSNQLATKPQGVARVVQGEVSCACLSSYQ